MTEQWETHQPEQAAAAAWEGLRDMVSSAVLHVLMSAAVEESDLIDLDGDRWLFNVDWVNHIVCETWKLIPARLSLPAPAAEATEAASLRHWLWLYYSDKDAPCPSCSQRGHADWCSVKQLLEPSARAAGGGAGYKAARGVAPLQPGEELPEARIRRIRDGEA